MRALPRTPSTRLPARLSSLTLAAVACVTLLGCSDERVPRPPPADLGSSPPAARPAGGGGATGAMPAGHPPAGGSGAFGDTGGAAAPAPVAWDVPEGWTQQPGTNSMRAAQFPLGTDDAGSSVDCIVYTGIGGGTQANIDRWVGQFTLADGTAAKDAATTTRTETNGLTVVRVEVVGKYVAQAMPGQGQPLNADDWMLLGAVVEGAGAPCFVKLVGPRALLEKNEAQFDALLGSFKPAR